ncbi:hypothetical protein BGLA2_2120002 [Burkholderia gladioli]|nr:hypothetical protein BGLA2_2120002 [Burkholderia gladioli]
MRPLYWMAPRALDPLTIDAERSARGFRSPR